jgi:ketosteroid isomerase-like protein
MIEPPPPITAQAGDSARVSGSYRETIVHSSGGAPIRVHGSYLLVLRHASDAGWQIERVMWSDDR